MKQLFFTFFVLAVSISTITHAQSTTATNLGNPLRYLGYSNNFSLQTRTNNITRTKINSNINYGVGGYGATQKNGYMMLGFSQGFAAPFFTPNSPGAYSLLHLNGPNGSFVQSGGYRPWMQTGITFTDNNDLSYIGIRSIAQDITETTIAWSDKA